MRRKGVGLSVKDVERWTLHSNTRTALQQSDNFRKQFHLARHHIGSHAGKPIGRAWASFTPPFWVILKAISQLQSNHLENETICKKSVVSFSLFDNFLANDCAGTELACQGTRHSALYIRALIKFMTYLRHRTQMRRITTTLDVLHSSV